MKKLYRIFSILLVVTLLVGGGWYFLPTDEVSAGARNFIKYVNRVRDDFNNDNISSEGVKVDDPRNDSYGNLGDKLSFISLTCPYRGLLTPKEQKVYNQIYANAIDCAGTFRLVCALSFDELNETYIAVICDHPEIFWLDNRYQYGYATDDKSTAVQFTLEYNDLRDELHSAKARFDSAAEKIVRGATQYTDAPNREKYVFDTIAADVDYNDNAACNQTAYSALVGHSTVCAGYSRAVQYILNELGIPCCYIFGTADGGYHAWNIVQLGGEWYGVDLTWSDQPTGVNYTYFNVTDAVLSADHSRSDMSKKLPNASGTRYTSVSKKAEPTSQAVDGNINIRQDKDTVESVDEYNSICFSQISASGLGTYSFSMTWSGEDLYNKICAAAKQGDYKAGYLDAAAAVLGLEKYNYDFKIDGDLDENWGRVILTQRVTLTEG